MADNPGAHPQKVLLDSPRDAADGARPAELSPLSRDTAFWGITTTQFLGAYNDNLFKQLMLLLAVPVGAAAQVERDQQGLATMIFSLPFVLFSGYAGFLSDRYSKRRIIVLAKVAEIGAMLLGMAAFLAFATTDYRGLLAVLFLMGTHSAFFGPGKYGILPEMLREADLPRANGIIVMTTFLAIIFGTASAGFLGDVFVRDNARLEETASRLWVGSAFCVTIALAGTFTSLAIRRVPPAKPDLQFRLSSLAVPPDTRKALADDRPLVLAILATCVFWLVGGIAIQAVNSFGLVQLGVGKFWTSVMTATIGLGIAMGAVAAGRLCGGRADFRVVRLGLWGLAAFLVVLSFSRPGGAHLLGFSGSLLILILLGVSAGLFAIPLQVFIQIRSPESQRGRMIAVMNQANFIAILLSGAVYSLFDRIVEGQGWPRSALFAMMAATVLPLAILYRPRNDELEYTVG